MNESQFIVPPDNGSGNKSVAPIQPIQPKPSQPTGPNLGKPGKSRKGLIASLAGAAIIVGLVATVLITKQPVNLFGYQLNPLAPQAACPIDSNCVPDDGGGTGVPTTPPSTPPVADSPTVQLIMGDSNSSSPSLPNSCNAEVNGPSNNVTINGDADCLKVTIANPQPNYLKDFRICFTLDNTGEQCTGWASTNGGPSAQVMSGGQFSSAQVRVETRNAPTGKMISGVEVGVQVFYQDNNNACGETSGLNFAKAIAGQNTSNPWSYGAQQDDDPGCALMSLRSQLVDAPPTSTAISINGELTPGTVGVQTSQPLTLSGTPNTPCTWEVRNTTLPPFAAATMVTPAGTGTTSNFQATPGAAGTYTVTVQTTCQNAQIATKTFNWVVNSAPAGAINIEGTLTPGTVGVQTSQPLTLSGTANTPCNWQVRTTTLPPFANATMVTPAGGNGTTSNFQATPLSAGTFSIRIQVTCQNAQIADQTLSWLVNAAPTGSTLSIAGSFPNGTVGQAYTTNISTVNAGTSNCTFTLTGINPRLPSATITRVNNVANATETLGLFSATPPSAQTYVVSTSVSCPPIAGDGTNGPTRTATKDFNWVVTAGGGGPGGGGGTAANCTDPANLPFLTAIYRSWSPARGDHLYTTSATEKPAGYRAEGIAGYVYNRQVTGTVPIYRSSQPQLGAHYYSTTNDATNYGYTNEGILGYTFASSVTGSAPWYRMHKGGATSDYVHTVSLEEKNAIVELGYVDEGVVAQLCGTPQPTALQPIFRMYNNSIKEHFYTTNPAERDAVLNQGYISEGITGYMYGVRKQGTSAVYRSYHRTEKHHYFSLTENEATGWGYTVEGIVGYVWPSSQANTIPLYKLFNARTRDNLYTASQAEVNSAVAAGYENQGILGYMFLTAQ